MDRVLIRSNQCLYVSHLVSQRWDNSLGTKLDLTLNCILGSWTHTIESVPLWKDIEFKAVYFGDLYRPNGLIRQYKFLLAK